MISIGEYQSGGRDLTVTDILHETLRKLGEISEDVLGT